MKIHVNRVPEDGLRERERYDPAPLDMERGDIHLPEPFDVEAFITKSRRELMVKVQIRCPLRFTCARCLGEFTATLTPSGVFSYTVSSAQVVDITNDVRQEIMLAYPIVPLCKSDCKGLCASCGQDLNTETCRHQGASEPPTPSG